MSEQEDPRLLLHSVRDEWREGTEGSSCAASFSEGAPGAASCLMWVRYRQVHVVLPVCWMWARSKQSAGLPVQWCCSFVCEDKEQTRGCLFLWCFVWPSMDAVVSVRAALFGQAWVQQRLHGSFAHGALLPH
eukprot:scaffold207672_cov17-Tisochrysis_lutea.AAC.1